VHVWQGGEGAAGEQAGASEERRPQTSGPFSPVRPPSRRRGHRARGSGLTAAAREAGRKEGGGAAPGGRSCPRARRHRSTPHPPAQPRHETLTAARPALLASAGTDRQPPRRRTRAPLPGAKCARRAETEARRGERLRARGLGTRCQGVSSAPRLRSRGRGARTGWLGISSAPKRSPGSLLGGGRSASPGAPAGAGARSACWARGGGGGGAAVAIQGLRAAAMQPEEAGEGRKGGRERGESQRRASQREGAGPPGWHRGRERSGRGAGRELLRARAARGSVEPPGPGGACLLAATGGFCQKFCRTSAGKPQEHFGE
jgi:hypothetical protein